MDNENTGESGSVLCTVCAENCNEWKEEET
jgi:hypothetical protein